MARQGGEGGFEERLKLLAVCETEGLQIVAACEPCPTALHSPPWTPNPGTGSTAHIATRVAGGSPKEKKQEETQK